jgi:hypothetical protein
MYVCKTRKRHAIHLSVSGPVISLKAPYRILNQAVATPDTNTIAFAVASFCGYSLHSLQTDAFPVNG